MAVHTSLGARAFNAVAGLDRTVCVCQSMIAAYHQVHTVLYNSAISTVSRALATRHVMISRDVFNSRSVRQGGGTDTGECMDT